MAHLPYATEAGARLRLWVPSWCFINTRGSIVLRSGPHPSPRKEGGQLTRRPRLRHVKSIAMTLKSCGWAAGSSGGAAGIGLKPWPPASDSGVQGGASAPPPPRPSRQPACSRTECHPLGLRRRRWSVVHPRCCPSLPAGRARHPHREKALASPSRPSGSPPPKPTSNRNGEAEGVQAPDPCPGPIDEDRNGAAAGDGRKRIPTLEIELP